jgi:two-component system chemotaxis sensor kinase CheA
MTIRLPLTLAIIDGFLVKISKSFYVIPLEMIVECIEFNDYFKENMNDNNYINLRGNMLPILDLSNYFGIATPDDVKSNIVIVQFADQKVGLIVDELHGEFQTVIKPLGKVFTNARGIGGATILGSGEVAMIIDVPALMNTK